MDRRHVRKYVSEQTSNTAASSCTLAWTTNINTQQSVCGVPCLLGASVVSISSHEVLDWIHRSRADSRSLTTDEVVKWALRGLNAGSRTSFFLIMATTEEDSVLFVLGHHDGGRERERESRLDVVEVHADGLLLDSNHT